MGSGSYHHDVQTARDSIGTTRPSAQAFDYHARAEAGDVQGVHPDLNIHGKIRECCDSPEHPATTPIVVAMDVTGSRGNDARVVYEQVPSFLGSLKVANVVPDPQICWVAVGDAFSDRAPLQVAQFESDRRLDTALSHLWMEGGGGGSGEESYELVAYALARKTKLDATKRGKKGFVFFTADEAPYPEVQPEQVKRIFGDRIEKSIPTTKIFTDLGKQYLPFLIFSQSPANTSHREYNSEVVLGKWSRYIPKSHILPIKDASSTVEVMLGVLALHDGTKSLADFEGDMKERKVPAKRREDVLNALTEFARNGVKVEVGEAPFS